RTRAKADAFCRDFDGVGAYADYSAAIEDPKVDAVVIAVPPRYHLTLTLAARDRAGRVVLVGENDHYKPLAVQLRRLLAAGTLGEMVFAHFTTIAHKLKAANDWRNDEEMAGGDAFFEEGIHWLHLANSLGPRI